ncbi:MAG: hypothetical protein R3C31_05975 [Hyphomonadaceae bacterium]
MCWSKGQPGSEAMREKLTEVIKACSGKAVTAFASNVARVETTLMAARAADVRRVTLDAPHLQRRSCRPLQTRRIIDEDEIGVA